MLLLSPVDFLKIIFFKKFRNNIRVSNSLDPDLDGHSVGPDLDPNCLQRLLAEDQGKNQTPMLIYPARLVL